MGKIKKKMQKNKANKQKRKKKNVIKRNRNERKGCVNDI